MENFKYTIAPSGRHNYQWILYLGILLVGAYLYLAYDIYQDEAWSSEVIINLLIAIIYAGIIYYNLTSESPHDKISFSEKGVTVSGEIKQEQEVIEWANLQKISITNNALFLDFKDGSQKELNISYLKYNQLQETKHKIRSFCEQYQLSFSSKY